MKPRKEKPQEELFPFIEMEKLVPANHILCMIDRYVDFSFIDELVDHTYSEVTGRPATDPELMVQKRKSVTVSDMLDAAASAQCNNKLV